MKKLDCNKFIVLEGIDGTGKSTLTKQLSRKLNHLGMSTQAISPPVDRYSEIVDFVKNQASMEAHFHYFISAVLYFSDQLEELLQTQNIVCDRYIYSTLAYHRARGLLGEATKLESFKFREPDFKFYLFVDESVRMERIRNRPDNTKHDYLGKNKNGLLADVEDMYEKWGLTKFDNTNLDVNQAVDEIISLSF